MLTQKQQHYPGFKEGPGSYNRILKIFRILSKITWHEELGTSPLHRKKQSTDANIQMTQMLELSDKQCEVATIKMLQEAIANTLEMIGKIGSPAEKQKLERMKY